MSFTGRTPAPRIPRTPTLPQGETVATYGTYLEAQKAVDHLAEKAFPVQLVTIVGTDLRMVERVLRRLTYSNAALGGFLSGAWFGLFVALLLSLFSTAGSANLFLPAILIGGAFGLLFSVITYSFSRGRRDFTSTSQIVATSYAVLCAQEKAHQARQLLREVGGVHDGWVRPAAPAADVPAAAAPPSAQPEVPPAPAPQPQAPQPEVPQQPGPGDQGDDAAGPTPPR